MSAGVRTASPEDLPGIVSLYSRVYPKIGQVLLEERARYLQLLLFEHPWRSFDFSSLVYEDNAGHIIGFLGVIPRPMLFHDQLVCMTISNNYMVDPMNRGSMAGISLAKTFFNTEQTLTVCQPGKGASQKIWKAFGAIVPLAHGLSWVWPLRPASYVLSRLGEREISPFITALMRPVSALLDQTVRKLSTPIPEKEYPKTIRYNLTLEELLEAIEESSRHYSLRPLYDLNTLKWSWDILLQKKQYGELRRYGVRTSNGEQIGYYVYYVQPNGIGLVIQIGARAGSFAAVLNDLGSDAMESGVLALSGWVDGRYVEEISMRAYYLKHRGDPVFIHTRDRNVQLSVVNGDTFFTPLESEWWTWFPSSTQS